MAPILTKLFTSAPQGRFKYNLHRDFWKEGIFFFFGKREKFMLTQTQPSFIGYLLKIPHEIFLQVEG